MTPNHEVWKIGDRRLHGQPRGWFPGPWWLVDLEEEAAARDEKEANADDEKNDESNSAGGVQTD